MSRSVSALVLLGCYLLIPPVHVKDARPRTETSPTQPAKGRFLVASHRLTDPNFFETVVLLLAYGPTGAVGVVINRPMDIRLGSVLRDVEELRDRSDPVYLGGPVVKNLLLVLLRTAKQPESSEVIFDGVYASGSRAAVREVLKKPGKRNRVRGYAGYAAWGPGQLDREVARGDWHITAADATMVFDMTASAIWPKLIQRFSGEWTRHGMPIEPRDVEELYLSPVGLSILSMALGDRFSRRAEVRSATASSSRRRVQRDVELADMVALASRPVEAAASSRAPTS